jgi:SAM-dependent methyltransferase
MGERDVHMYGETPFAVWKEIIKAADLKREDRFLDLGCGRGRLCFWTWFLIGCRSTGIDWVPTFVRRARFIVWLFRISGVQFFCKKLSEAPLEEATVVYLYTYHPEEEQIDFSGLPEGARVITVSEPLMREGFVVQKTLEARYPWGYSEVFVSVKTL